MVLLVTVPRCVLLGAIRSPRLVLLVVVTVVPKLVLTPLFTDTTGDREHADDQLREVFDNIDKSAKG